MGIKEDSRALAVEALNIQKDNERKIGPAELRVKGDTEATDLSGSIIKKCREFGYAEVRAIGSLAIGVATKGSAIAMHNLYSSGYEWISRYSFWQTQINKTNLKEGDEGVRTGFTIHIEPR